MKERNKINKILRKELNSEVLSPEEFREEYEKNRDKIESAKIISPEFGSNNSGYVLVKRQDALSPKPLTGDSFNDLLSVLGETSEEQGINYEKLRGSLIRSFIVRGINRTDAYTLTDEAINRLANQIISHRDEKLDFNKIFAYARTIAHYINLEAQGKNKDIAYELADAITVEYTEYDKYDDTLEKMRKALKTLTEDERNIILSYYGAEKNEKVSTRRKLIENSGIRMSSLQVRAFRIRQKLKRIMENS